MSLNLTRLILVWALFFCLNIGWAQNVHVAVAANFAKPLQDIASAFTKTTGYTVTMSTGATSKFYAQIIHGAPFDMLLAADQATPTRLADEGRALPATQFTYAIGQLVLWSASDDVVDDQGRVVKQGQFQRLAMASNLSPYGIAAREALIAMKCWDALSSKRVQGVSVGQAYSFIATGNAELGFIALSQVWENSRLKSGSIWRVPEHLYTPLRQDAILLKRAENKRAAHAFLAFLKSDAAKDIMVAYGYQR